MSTSKDTNPNYPSRTGNHLEEVGEIVLNQHRHPKVETPERSSY
ncbi:hypothetical protein PGH12_01525 [Chryseobacterium wangxinyae]|nr:hypothetical protein [Chryseobacterium sp. CY350]MCY0977139.1 hypothetical protein [Chryseobacterium sp. CY350]WBZ95841.1 hypothetical protein PGH12_01525 [Chryseobacterium sp. CY350]